jgi:hypothetical protein
MADDETVPEQIAVRWLREGDRISTEGREGPFREIRKLHQDDDSATSALTFDDAEDDRMAMGDVVWARLARPEKIRLWPTNDPVESMERDPDEVAADFLDAMSGGFQAEETGSVQEAFMEWLSTAAGAALVCERRDRRWLVEALERQLGERQAPSRFEPGRAP